ncbi:MAG: prepilin-type N-terminal cleavage/methylation domain-containing protein [Candidatus Riflebacteria bacterium]|nr:prepilin-type N-terminal cleavage/methylation domain-containing protein [Candidatus Riflebacteria bacterium]
MKIFKMRKGFTLVEIIIVCGIATVFLGTAIMLFTNFRRGYSRSEGTAILMQEGALFVARLRTDLNNAVLIPDSPGGSSTQLNAGTDSLNFMVYNSHDAKAQPVVYRYLASDIGGSLFRREGTDNERELIKGHVASLTWQTNLERFIVPGSTSSGTMRLSIGLDIQLRIKSGSEKPFALKTSIFPARLNRQLNNP